MNLLAWLTGTRPAAVDPATTAATSAWLASNPPAVDAVETVEVGALDPTERGGCDAEDVGWLCTRETGHTGQHVAGTGSHVAAVWPNTADADAALVATAEHLGNEVGPDRTAAIGGLDVDEVRERVRVALLDEHQWNHDACTAETCAAQLADEVVNDLRGHWPAVFRPRGAS